MEMGIGTSIRICILSFIISAHLLSQVSSAKPIFGKCLDTELGSVLKVITVNLDQTRRVHPIDEIDTNEKVDNIMRMIKKYLMDAQTMDEATNAPSRKFFFWPFFPWPVPKAKRIFGGLGANIQGGLGPDGFTLTGGLNGQVFGEFDRDDQDYYD